METKVTENNRPNGPQAKQSALYDRHLKLAAKSRIVPFAGYLMPLWYSSISNEHNAVRKNAGLFDCTHMGVIEISGQDAQRFLNVTATNDVTTLPMGKAHYSYILDDGGHILDDIIVYRRGDDNFMVVVNAANEPKIKKHLEDLQSPDSDMPQRVNIRDMRDTNTAGDCRVDIALQGPASTDILARLIDDELKKQVEALKPFSFVEGKVDGVECIISRTGYTGSKVGYELFVPPADAPAIWDKLLETGKDKGLEPCGLGARDSLRIEAGLPLYGHELAGKFDISPFEAGYEWAVKLEKENFIGKAEAIKQSQDYNMRVARMELPGGKGIRPVRQNDCVVDDNDKCVGYVLSSTKVDEKQIAIVYVKKELAEQGSELGVHYMPRKATDEQMIDLGEKAEGNINGETVKRFARF
jgi:glycine hydroxymethyltransferase